MKNDPKTETTTRTITFQPNDAARQLIDAAIDATGESNRSILLNAAVIFGMAAAVKHIISQQTSKRDGALKIISSLSAPQPKTR